jgi:hypothetical protein
MKRSFIFAFLICLSTLGHAESTPYVVVKSVRYGKETISMDTGPAVRNPWTGGYDAGYHGTVLGCNTEEPTCYAPHQGDIGEIISGPHVYTGPNMTIRWQGGDTGTYALHEEY